MIPEIRKHLESARARGLRDLEFRLWVAPGHGPEGIRVFRPTASFGYDAEKNHSGGAVFGSSKPHYEREKDAKRIIAQAVRHLRKQGFVEVSSQKKPSPERLIEIVLRKARP